MSKDIKQFIRENEALFWGVKPDEKENISLNDSIIPNHSGDMSEGTLSAILKESGISPDEFQRKSYGWNALNPPDDHNDLSIKNVNRYYSLVTRNYF